MQRLRLLAILAAALNGCASNSTSSRVKSVTPARALATNAQASSLARAAATAILGQRDGTVACVVRRSHAGSSDEWLQFDQQLERDVARLSPASDSAHVVSFELASIEPGDSAAVSVRVSGDNGPNVAAFWVNYFTLRFVPSETPTAWRLVARQFTGAEDYVSEGPRTTRPVCMNAILRP